MVLDAELIADFKVESKGLIAELKALVEMLKKPSTEFPSALLSEFSQKIDRIMGTAKTFATMDPENSALRRISQMTALCKAIGYKAAERKEARIIQPVAVIWTDVLKVVEVMVDTVEKPEEGAVAIKSLAIALKDRLKWLSGELNIDFKPFLT